MNYIWEPLIKMQQQGMALEELHYFVLNNRVSPYLELQADSLYEKELTKESIAHIDTNPYVRFPEIFQKFITADDLGYGEFNEALADVVLHYLADLDMKMGMGKREFHIRSTIKDLEQGAMGSKEEFGAFTAWEKRVLADGLLTSYQTADPIGCLVHVIGSLLPYCQVLARDGEEIVFYMREPENKRAEVRAQWAIKLFLPIQYNYVIHWMETYGVAGFDGTMGLEGFVV